MRTLDHRIIVHSHTQLISSKGISLSKFILMNYHIDNTINHENYVVEHKNEKWYDLRKENLKWREVITKKGKFDYGFEYMCKTKKDNE